MGNGLGDEREVFRYALIFRIEILVSYNGLCVPLWEYFELQRKRTVICVMCMNKLWELGITF